ncbi:MAG: FAD-binding protein [Kouleothrix sp.]|nr:FAD-binding protein [Kouleothrix sp.]
MPIQESILSSLARILDAGQLLTSPVELITYEGDASMDRGRPDGVVFPRNADDVVKIVSWAARHGVPIVARGAGTGLSGGAVADRGGLIVECSRLDRVLELDEAGRSAVVQPGVINLALDSLVKTKGLYYPPDPASGRSSTLGGNIAENAGGPHCFKYGVTSNYISGLEVVLADGRSVRLGGRALDYPEYDLAALLTGSEGTLGIITSASVRLLRNPPAVKTMMAAFDSVEQAGEAVSAVIAAGLVPATMEMMDQRMMRIIEEVVHVGLPIDAGAALIIEADGYPESVGPQIDEIAAILRDHRAFNLHIAESAEERDKIWYGRKSAAGAMARLAPAYYLVDGTVPRSKLAATLAGVNQICEAADLRVGYVFHAGDGNLHPFILVERPADRALVQHVIEAGRAILALCVSYDGSITGEHGVGIEKRQFMPLMYSPAELDAMREIKAVFDPRELLNPDKIFPTKDEGGWRKDEVQAPPPIAHPSSFILHPSTAEQAAEAIRAWTSEGRSIRVRGGGTKSALLPAADATLSTAALRGIRAYALEDLYVTVGAGTPLAELQAELARDRMWVPLASPWPEATVGGVVAANFNAPLRMRYGAARDLVLAATVALPDGRVIRAGRPVVKNVAGYDLPKLFVGSYGTLGLLADVTLKLAPLPRARASLIALVDDLAGGLALGARLLQICMTASSLLLVSPESVRARYIVPPHSTNGSSQLGNGDCPAAAGDRWSLIYTAEGHPGDVATELAQARAALRQAGAADFQVAQPSGSEVWAGWLRAAAPGEPLVRLGVAPKDLPGLLRTLALPDEASFVADLASGLVYLRGAVDSAPLRLATRALAGYAAVLAGPANAHAASDTWGHAPDGLDLMRAIKARWDARGLFNPGAFIV